MPCGPIGGQKGLQGPGQSLTTLEVIQTVLGRSGWAAPQQSHENVRSRRLLDIWSSPTPVRCHSEAGPLEARTVVTLTSLGKRLLCQHRRLMSVSRPTPGPFQPTEALTARPASRPAVLPLDGQCRSDPCLGGPPLPLPACQKELLGVGWGGLRRV